MSEPLGVLVVEDDEDDFFFTKRALRKATPAPIFRLESGNATIEYLAGTGPYANREEFPLPSLVFLDLKMDAGSGHDVLTWVQANMPGEKRPRIFVLTGSNEPRDRELVKNSGAAAGYIVKPLTVEHLQLIFGAAPAGR
jgi:CheY-like chemotaxis protein